MRYRIRTLLVLVTISTVALAYYGQATRESRALHMLRSHGAQIKWVTSLGFFSKSETPLPVEEQHYTVTLNAAWDGQSLNPLLDLRKVRRLVVHCDAKLTEADLDVIARIRDLERVQLHSELVDDEYMRRLAGLPRLHTLHIRSSRVTDRGVLHLSGAERLEQLTLSGTKLGDAGLGALTDLPNIWKLVMYDTMITDQGMAHLPATLKTLAIARTRITDVGIESIAQLPKLSYFDIRQTAISDVGLEMLRDHPALNRIAAFDTDATPQGIRSLYDAWASRDAGGEDDSRQQERRPPLEPRPEVYTEDPFADCL